MNQADGNRLTHYSCPACGSSEIFQLTTFTQFPAIIFPVEKPNCHSVRVAPLCTQTCQTCGHLFLNNVDTCFSESVYTDYYHVYPYKNLESMRGPYREPFDKIMRMYFHPKAASLLEIGCDSVDQMECFLAQGYSCTAINPGAQPHKNVHFIDGFYGKTNIDAHFDYIVSRFNLEHILDLPVFFETISKNLSANGIAIIQVPNVELYLRAGLLNVFAHEHAHYFCQSSLLAAIKRWGYQVLHISDRGEPSLICVFCHQEATKFQEAHEYIKRSSQVLAEVRQVIRSAKGEVFLYGAGLSLSALLYDGLLEEKTLTNIKLLDDNPVLWGRFMPNTLAQIMPLEEAHIATDAVIILMLSEQYQQQVLEKIAALKISCEVFAVTGKGLINILKTLG